MIAMLSELYSVKVLPETATVIPVQLHNFLQIDVGFVKHSFKSGIVSQLILEYSDLQQMLSALQYRA